MIPVHLMSTTRRRPFRHLAPFHVVLCLLLVLGQQVSCLSWEAGHLYGNGFMNVLGFSPFNPQRVLAGGDVAGYFWSDDGAQTWHPGNIGLYWADNIGAVKFSAHFENYAYGCSGPNGGFGISSDNGASWILGSSTPQCNGNNAPAADRAKYGYPHPRPTGDIIVDLPGLIYVGTYNSGVMRASVSSAASLTPGGLTFATVANTNGFNVRSMLYDSHYDCIWVGGYDATNFNAVPTPLKGGIYRIDSASSTSAVSGTLLANSPGKIDGVARGGDWLYAVGAGGVWRCDVSTSSACTSWQDIMPSSIMTPNDTVPYSVVASASAVYVGVTNPAMISRVACTVMKGTVVGSSLTWSCWPSPSSSVTFALPVTGETWWTSVGDIRSSSATVSTILFDPVHGENVLWVVGRSTVWRWNVTADFWQSYCNGYIATSNNPGLIDPNADLGSRSTTRFVWGNTDFTFFYSDKGLLTDSVRRNVPPGADSKGWSVAVDPTTNPSTFLVGTGDRDFNINGQLFITNDITSTTSWTRLTNYETLTTHGRPLAVALFRDASNTQISLCWSQGFGMVRGIGNSFSKITIAGSNPSPSATTQSRIEYAGDGLVYFIDGTSGLYRSKDYGQSFSSLWITAAATSPHPALSAVGNDLYIISKGRIYYLANAATVTATPLSDTAATLISPASSCNAQVVTNRHGLLYMVDIGCQTANPNMYVCPLPCTSAAHWTTEGDNYLAAAGWACRSISVAADYTVYLSTGNGLLVGINRTGATTTPSATTTTPASTTTTPSSTTTTPSPTTPTPSSSSTIPLSSTATPTPTVSETTVTDTPTVSNTVTDTPTSSETSSPPTTSTVVSPTTTAPPSSSAQKGEKKKFPIVVVIVLAAVFGVLLVAAIVGLLVYHLVVKPASGSSDGSRALLAERYFQGDL